MKNLKHPELAVTWVELNDDLSMSYISHTDANHYKTAGIDYESLALDNLRQHSQGQLFTHAKRVSSKLIFAAAMHPDGLGSSRLLLVEDWFEVFPQGFHFALPERSCAIVFSAHLSAHDQQDVLGVVDECYTGGTTPMLPGFHSPEQFAEEFMVRNTCIYPPKP
jgi:hypothetical protein